MASVSTDSNGNRRILFLDLNRRRQAIYVGSMPLKQAGQFADYLKQLVGARRNGLSLDGGVMDWLGRLGPAMHDRLAHFGLIEPRQAVQVSTVPNLGEFLDSYIAGRTDAKPRTRHNLEITGRRMTEYFGRDRLLDAITEGEAEQWSRHLKSIYAPASVGRAIRRARQFFTFARRSKFITENPFSSVKAPPQTNEKRKHFIPTDVAQQVIEACPDAEWRLIVALSRFGGLRCPSEHLALTWDDIDWARDRFRVRSPKTEHHSDGGIRWVPIFPELRQHLEDVAAVAPRSVHVINRYRDANANLRTQFQRIIARAKVEPWPKLFHNLRASRETELVKRFPLHIVGAWLGNTAIVAAKHYLQVTDADFEQAATQIPTQYAAVATGMDSHGAGRERENPGEMPGFAEKQQSGIPLRGSELPRENARNTRRAESGHAESNARDPSLAALIAAWPHLPADVRQRILELAAVQV